MFGAHVSTTVGEPRDRGNVLRVLRQVFTAAEVPWATSHACHHTVAPWKDEGAGLAEIANQLGRAADIMRLPGSRTMLAPESQWPDRVSADQGHFS